MDTFDQYLFNELVGIYENGMVANEYEEVYQRFENLSYLPEVQPYLLTMRYFGWGTEPQPEAALNELSGLVDESDHQLAGLYYDLLLCSEPGNPEYLSQLKKYINSGYSNIYLKKHSHMIAAY